MNIYIVDLFFLIYGIDFDDSQRVKKLSFTRSDVFDRSERTHLSLELLFHIYLLVVFLFLYICHVCQICYASLSLSLSSLSLSLLD